MCYQLVRVTEEIVQEYKKMKAVEKQVNVPQKKNIARDLNYPKKRKAMAGGNYGSGFE